MHKKEQSSSSTRTPENFHTTAVYFSSDGIISGPQIRKMFKTVGILYAFVKGCSKAYFHQHPKIFQ